MKKDIEEAVLNLLDVMDGQPFALESTGDDRFTLSYPKTACDCE